MTTEVRPSRMVDCRNELCPTPVIRAKLAIDLLSPGEILEILATDPGAESDFKSWSRVAGHELLSINRLDGTLRVLVAKGLGPAPRPSLD